MDNQLLDFEWFKANLKDLYEKYGDAYIVIKNKSVIGSYCSYAEGVKATSKIEPLGSFIVQQCAADESVFTAYISSVYFAE